MHAGSVQHQTALARFAGGGVRRFPLFYTQLGRMWILLALFVVLASRKKKATRSDREAYIQAIQSRQGPKQLHRFCSGASICHVMKHSSHTSIQICHKVLETSVNACMFQKLAWKHCYQFQYGSSHLCLPCITTKAI